jgi:hypothetical protein
MKFKKYGNRQVLALVPALALGFCQPAHAGVSLVINEFMADNKTTVADPQGAYDDWIEIYNAGTETADLGGMYLTDDLLNPTQWQFPAGTVLGPESYLLVWADEDVLDDGLHANFKLSSEGEEIALYSTNGITQLDSVSFTDQSEDISYGRFPNGGNSWYFMDQPSPLAANTSAQSEAIFFSRLSGVMTNAFTLKLSTPSDRGSIRYTTDGSIPSTSSTLYDDDSGIEINSTASQRIRARAFQDNLAPGPVRTEAYLAVSPALKAFDSNLPIVVIDTFGQELLPSWWDNSLQAILHPDPIATYAAVINTNESTGRAAVTDQPDFAGRTGMRERGQSSQDFPKKPYKFETWDENDQDTSVSFLGMPADSDWVLSSPYTDKTFMRNALVYKWSNDMGHYAARSTFVEVFINTDGGQIGGPATSDYMGTYLLMESIKRGEDRVNIEKLDSSATAEPEITGGYIIKHDKNRDEAEFWTWAGRWFYVEPSDTEITTPQKNYIEGYLEEFETVLQSDNFADPDVGYAQYIDVESFIDHDLCMEITRDVDPYRYSTYVTKDRGGKLKMAPEWDYNWSMGNNDYSNWNLEYHHAIGWHHEEADALSPTYNWHERLKDDPEYLRAYADRWFHLREDVLSDTTMAQTIEANYALLNAEAAARNFDRWDILNTEIWPNFYFGGGYGSSTHTYGMQVEFLKNWLTGLGTQAGSAEDFYYSSTYSDRLGWMDANMGNLTGAGAPPAFFINGSPANTGSTISMPETLTMTGSSGTIYYTLDGTDPREAFTGDAVGTAYSTGTSAIILSASAPCSARIPTSADDAAGWKEMEYDDAGWLNGTTGVGFESSPGTYDYAPLIGLDVSSMQGANASAYIRVPFSLSDPNNVTSLTLNMKYDDAFVAYINGTEVQRSALAPATLSWDASATSWNDDANAVVFEEFDISTSMSALQEGDNLLAIHGLNASSGSSDLLFIPQLEATFSSGDGITLNKTVDVRARIKNGSSWSALNRAVFADDRPKDQLRITEIMYHPEYAGEEFIELQNIGDTTINLYRCEFTDGVQFTFPDISLAAGETVLVVENQTAFETRHGSGLNIAGEFDAGSSLDNGGEEIVLKDAAGRVIHDFDFADWYPVSDGHGASLCIIDPANTDLTLWDREAGWQASSASDGNPGAAHSVHALATGSIVINEVLTHTDEAGGDWIELHNTTAAPIDIGGWFLSDSLDDLMKYQIASGTTLPAGGYIVFAQESNFGVTSSDPGKLTGFGLSELGETVFLSSGSEGILGGGFSISEDFGAAVNGVTFGRHTKSAAAGYDIDFVAMATPTKGEANSAPWVPDVVINEIMYNPSQNHDEIAEYIELFNRSSDTVNLYDESNPSNTWKFTKGIDYVFPPEVSIAPEAHILVVRTDPDIFRQVHGIPLTCEIFGPYSDALNNDGEKLELSMPGAPEPGFVPYIRAEMVNFSDGAHPADNDPWPTNADGTVGYSLHRRTVAGYGNDVANWQAAAPTPETTDIYGVDLQQTEDGLVLFWTVDGVLQSTTQLTNDWTNLPAASSPYKIAPSQPAQFFRLYISP